MRAIVKLVRRIVGAGGDRRVNVVGFRYDPTNLTTRDDVTGVLGLTEREFVEAILVENGGRIWPKTIREVTDWSASQVRTLLDDLEDEGAVVRRRAGWETIVSLPGADRTVRTSMPR